jgi:hypothetical protein
MSISLPAVRDRVREIERFHYVSDVLSAADAMESFGGNPPQAFVSTASERAGPEKLKTIGRHRQMILQTVSVLFVLGAERADGDREDQTEAARLEIVEKLVAWAPPGAEGNFSYVSFSVVRIADGLVWGECLFAAPWLLSKAA